MQCNFLCRNHFVLCAVRLLVMLPFSIDVLFYGFIVDSFAWEATWNKLKTQPVSEQNEWREKISQRNVWFECVSWMVPFAFLLYNFIEFVCVFFLVFSCFRSVLFSWICPLSLSITCNFVKFTLIKPSLIIYDIHKFVIFYRA